jgi:hypothetical protein
MFNNIGGSSAPHSSYHSEANDPTPTSYDAPYGSGRSSRDQFSSLAPRADAVSEFGSAVSHELLGDYYAPHYQNPSAYSHWSSGARPRSESSAGSFGSADDRSFHDRSSAGSDASSHIPPSPATTSTVSSLHPLSDIGQALSEAGSGRSSVGHLSSHSSDKSDRSNDSNRSDRSDRSFRNHQNRLPFVSDGSAQRSLTGSEREAINAARQGGRFFSSQSDLGSATSGVGYDGGRFSRRGETYQPGTGAGGLHTIAENLSDAGGSNVSPERAAFLERLNRLREGFTIPSDYPRSAWQPDTDLSVGDINLSTSVTAGPPTRRPPPLPSRRGSTADSSQRAQSSAASSSQSTAVPRVHGPAIYGRQPAVRRAWNAMTKRR